MNGCIFCKIVAGKIPSTKVFENEQFLAFLTIEPKGPQHTLLIPKEHYRWFYELPEDIYDGLFRTARTLALELKTKTNTDYVKLLLDGKDVPHVHLHLIPNLL